MIKEKSSTLTGFFISGLIFLIFPVYSAMSWFKAASVSVDTTDAALIFKNTFSLFREIWVVIFVSFAFCLAVIYFGIRSIKHTNYWIKNFSLILIMLAIIFAILDLKWMFFK